jgi:hypothetical protein
VPLQLSTADRKRLEELVAQRTLRQGHARRVRVVLWAADGVSGVEIAQRVGLSEFQVSRIRRRFEEGGVDGLADRKKRGRGNNVPLEIVGQVLTAVMPPPHAGSRTGRRGCWPRRSA